MGPYVLSRHISSRSLMLLNQIEKKIHYQDYGGHIDELKLGPIYMKK